MKKKSKYLIVALLLVCVMTVAAPLGASAMSGRTFGGGYSRATVTTVGDSLQFSGWIFNRAVNDNETSWSPSIEMAFLYGGFF